MSFSSQQSRKLNQVLLFIVDITYHQSQDPNFFRDYIGNTIYSLRIAFNTILYLLKENEVNSTRVGVMTIRGVTFEMDIKMKHFNIIKIHKCLDKVLQSCSSYFQSRDDQDMASMAFRQYLKFLQNVPRDSNVCCVYISGDRDLKVSKETASNIELMLNRGGSVSFIRIHSPLEDGVEAPKLQLDQFGLHLPPRCRVYFTENDTMDIKRSLLLSLDSCLGSIGGFIREMKLCVGEGHFGTIHSSVEYEVLQPIQVRSSTVCSCHHLSNAKNSQAGLGGLLRCPVDGTGLGGRTAEVMKVNDSQITIQFDGFLPIGRILELSAIKKVPITTIPESIFFGTVGVLSPSKETFKGATSSSGEFNNAHAFAALSSYLNKRDLGLLMFYIQQTNDHSAKPIYHFVMCFGDAGGSRMFLKHIADGDLMMPLRKFTASFDNGISRQVEEMMERVETAGFSPLEVSSNFHECLNSLISNGESPEFVFNENSGFGQREKKRKKKKIRFRNL